jgi:hypothetical protein
VDRLLRYEESCEDNPYQRKDVKMEHIFIVSAEDAGDLCVRLTFNDGHQSVVDIGEFIRQHPHPQYNKYLDPDMFRTFVVDDGNVVWGEDWDLIFPIENLYIGKAA